MKGIVFYFVLFLFFSVQKFSEVVSLAMSPCYGEVLKNL